MKQYQAHLISHPNQTKQVIPRRWDGSKFREGRAFDAKDFNTPYEAQQILIDHGKNDLGLIPVVKTIEINSISGVDMNDNMEDWTIGDSIICKSGHHAKILEVYPETGLLEVGGKFGKDWIYTCEARLVQ
jgi:hypothetical protein